MGMEHDEIPEMDVPGFGVHRVLRVYEADEELPTTEDETLRFLVTKDGKAYQVPVEGA
jgi:hypothetical protein